MAVYSSMQELIGHTPLVKLDHLPLPQGVQLYAKLELYNPAGSVKDRVGQYMVADAERRGLLVPGSTIIEATAGNTGLGIAFAALGKNYRIVFVVPDKFSAEKQTLMRALGAALDGQIGYFIAGAGSGGTHADYDIEGIGNDFIAETMDVSLVDKVIKVTDADALSGVRLLASRKGIFAGSSSGASVTAAMRLAKQGVRGKMVVVLPDRGNRYFSKHICP